MFDREAIKELCKAQSIAAASDAVVLALESAGAVALPSDITVQDLEKFQPTRRRARGRMTTSSIDAFAEYVRAHAEEGACVFVAQSGMEAVAVLNLGVPEAPGHADNTAALTAQRSAPYFALQQITNAPKSQKEIAEFMEDWGDYVGCEGDDGQPMDMRLVVAAIRRMTIEQITRLQAESQSLSESRTAFDQVKASATDGKLPERIWFDCRPYMGLAARCFHMRLSVITGAKDPQLRLRIINQEQHDEEMADEFAGLVQAALAGKVPVRLGTYAPMA